VTLQRLLKRINYRLWLVLFLLGAGISGAFYGFNDAVRGLNELPWVGILGIGLLAGWAVAKARIRTAWAALLFLILAIIFSFGHYGRLLDALLRLERAWVVSVLTSIQSLLRWAISGFLISSPSIEAWLRSLLPNPEPVNLAWREIATSINVVIFHLQRWLESARLGERASDLVGVGVVWTFLFTLGAAWAVYATLRFTNPFLGLAPLLTGQAFALNYVNAKPYSLLAVIFAGLMATAFSRHFADEKRWQEEKTDYADYLTQDTGFTSLFLTGFIVLLAFFASLPPLVTIEDIENFLERLRREEGGQEIPAARSLGLEPRAEARSNFAVYQDGGLPRQHLLGSEPELSQRVVMTIQVEEELQSNEPSRLYYWRALTYDQYTGYGWRTSATQDRFYASRAMVLTVAPYRGLAVTTRINAVGDLRGLLYAPGELVAADHGFELSTRPVPQAPETYAGNVTLFAPDIFAARIDERSYRVSSLLPIVSASALRNAQPEYPNWVKERYLALPTDLSDRVLGLVLELTRDLDTPFEKAQAIETYLRTIPYSLDIPAPDPFVDVVDYFLFDLQKGYCDYYATAMVVMARAAGVPARLAVGYASGTYDPINRRFVVTEANAHSWVEVYFPGTGWVEFEPTAALPRITYQEEDPHESASTVIPAPPSPSGLPSAQELIGWGIIAFIAVGGVILIWNTYEAVRLRRLGVVKGITAIYRQLYRHSRPLTGKLSPGFTPLEFKDFLQGCLERDYNIPGWKNSLPATTKTLSSLTELYVQAIYSPHPPKFTDLKLAWQQWRLLRQYLWLARIGRRLRWEKKKS